MRSKWLLLFFLFICALFSASPLVARAVYGVIFFFLLFSLVGRRSFDRLKIERRLAVRKAFPGQPVEITIVAETASPLPLGWIRVAASRQPNLVLLGPHEGAGLVFGRSRLRMVYRVAGMRRGYYPLGGINVSGGDPMGWTSFERFVPDDGEGLTVYPRVWPLSGLPWLAAMPFGRRRYWLRAYEDPSWVGGIRDYTAGDSLRRIHWLATARLGRLQVKELVPTVASEVWIFLDLADEDYPVHRMTALSEVGIEAAASLLVHFHQQGTAVGLISNGRVPNLGGEIIFVPADPGDEVAESILTMLAGIQPVEGGVRFSSLPTLYGERTSRGSALFLLTPFWSEELTGIALTLGKRGREVFPLLLGRVKDGLPALAAGLPLMAVRRHPATGGVGSRRV
ncbi:MAG: DUF58 domain-containing protein [Firmicutes bacterium]|nr:DUF58 domain-containing protein [Bacillota bacterium]